MLQKMPSFFRMRFECLVGRLEARDTIAYTLCVLLLNVANCSNGRNKKSQMWRLTNKHNTNMRHY